MKALIIVFSPSGHTLTVSEWMKEKLISRGVKVQWMNITKDEKYLSYTDIKQNLEKEVDAHDVMLIGGPVYAGHVEKNILNVIEQLPDVGGKFGPLAVPFVTYGGVHSSVALEEMGRYLNRKKRKSILGLKIAAEHTLTKTMSHVINKQKPEKMEEKLIDEAVKRIIKIAKKDICSIKDVSQSFKYTKLSKRILFNMCSQEFFHKKFKNVSIHDKHCIQCKQCVLSCPVNMFYDDNGHVKMKPDKETCILCGECYHHCPTGAINYPYLEVGKKRLKDGYTTLEKSQSNIYP